MIKKIKLFGLIALVLSLFVLAGCQNNSEIEKLKDGKDGVSIVWVGAFASADEIENPQYLWAYYNTTDGCSYIYDGEKWTLLAYGEKGKNGDDSSVVLPPTTLEPTEVFIVTYETEHDTVPEKFYCMKGFKLTKEKLPVLQDEHYNQTSWRDGDSAATEGYEITKNTVLSAVWAPKKYKITYECDSITPPETVFVDYGTTLDDSYFPTISNDRYLLRHWEKNNSKVSAGYVVSGDVIFVGKVQDKNDVVITIVDSNDTNNKYVVHTTYGNTLYTVTNTSNKKGLFDLLISKLNIQDKIEENTLNILIDNETFALDKQIYFDSLLTFYWEENYFISDLKSTAGALLGYDGYILHSELYFEGCTDMIEILGAHEFVPQFMLVSESGQPFFYNLDTFLFTLNDTIVFSFENRDIIPGHYKVSFVLNECAVYPYGRESDWKPLIINNLSDYTYTDIPAGYYQEITITE